MNSGSVLEDESQEDEMSDQMASEEKEQGGQLDQDQTNREILNNP